jgi:small nuclear ribonucleoprotein|tara:strand:- start:42 stop:266 length:225 start_codon:yes stop_codon:yes gene_type:complete
MKIERPLDGLNEAKGKRIIIDMKNKKQIIGKLLAFDIHPNLVLDDAEEHEGGEMKKKLGRVFVRGDMVVTVIIQ